MPNVNTILIYNLSPWFHLFLTTYSQYYIQSTIIKNIMQTQVLHKIHTLIWGYRIYITTTLSARYFMASKWRKKDAWTERKEKKRESTIRAKTRPIFQHNTNKHLIYNFISNLDGLLSLFKLSKKLFSIRTLEGSKSGSGPKNELMVDCGDGGSDEGPDPEYPLQEFIEKNIWSVFVQN